MMANIRLYIGYALIALFLTAAGCAVTFYVITQRQQVLLAQRDTAIEKQQGKIDELKNAYSIQNESLNTIKKGMEISDALIAGLNESIRNVNLRSREVQNRIDILEANNAAYRDYLSTVLPEHGCVLDDTCTTGIPGAGSSTETQRRVDSPVPAAGNQTQSDQPRRYK